MLFVCFLFVLACSTRISPEHHQNLTEFHSAPARPFRGIEHAFWLWTNGVNTNGAAAEVRNFDRLGENIRPGTFGKIIVD